MDIIPNDDVLQKQQSPLESALDLVHRGLYPVPVSPSQKRPVITGWPAFRLRAEDLHKYFGNGRGAQNIGVILGVPTGLTDVDVDDWATLLTWPFFAPATDMIWGREGKPASHHCYIADRPVKTRKYSDPVNPKEPKRVGACLVERRGVKPDGTTGAQSVAPGSIHAGTGQAVRYEPGKDGLPSHVKADELERAVALAAASALLARHWPAEGSGGHRALLALAGTLRKASWNITDTTRFCTAVLTAAGRDAVELEKVGSNVRSTFDRGAAGGTITGAHGLIELVESGKKVVNTALKWLEVQDSATFPHGLVGGLSTRSAPAALPDLGQHPYNDFGNGQRFVALYGDTMRYCHTAKNWVHWVGTHWSWDEVGEARKNAQSTIIEFGKQALTGGDAAAAKFASACLNSNRVSNLLREAEPHLAVTRAELDRDPFLFNCATGTIDLRTGALREHRRADYITLLSPVSYDPDAHSELWEKALDQWTDNKELRSFLQRAAGYSLTGSTAEEVLFFVHGPAAAGKSTFLEALKAVLGPFAKTADFESFIQQKNSNIRNDIAELAGRRMVLSIEVDEGKRLAEGLVKQVTGGDTIRARYLYQESFEFAPQFKLWLAANHAPKVSDDDSAMWRRILRVPFEHVIEKKDRDPKVKARMKDTNDVGPAILAWAVEGCLQWQRDGLNIPDVVAKATEEYRQDQDPLKDFFDQCCVFGDALQVTTARLREVYEPWCRNNGDRPLGSREFNERLRRRGCAETNKIKVLGKDQRGWKGIGIPDNSQDREAPTDDGWGQEDNMGRHF